MLPKKEKKEPVVSEVERKGVCRNVVVNINSVNAVFICNDIASLQPAGNLLAA